jgi:hypothetical protein
VNGAARALPTGWPGRDGVDRGPPGPCLVRDPRPVHSSTRRECRICGAHKDGFIQVAGLLEAWRKNGVLVVTLFVQLYSIGRLHRMVATNSTLKAQALCVRRCLLIAFWSL